MQAVGTFGMNEGLWTLFFDWQQGHGLKIMFLPKLCILNWLCLKQQI